MRLITVKKYAKEKNLCRSRIQQMICKGELKTKKVGNQNFIIEDEKNTVKIYDDQIEIL